MKIINLSKIYHNKNNDRIGLNHINLDLDSNGITMILGPSGCGKTTLLNAIAGRIDFEGSIVDVPNFDYLTQEFNLFEDMTIMDNLTIVSRKKKLIDRYLQQFELVEHKDKKVKKLSNGQKKRVQFIRALLHKPGMLLCDEPTSALDHENTIKLMDALKSLSGSIQIIMVTHDTALAEKYADRIIQMDQGIIISDTVIENKQQCINGSHIEKKSLKDTLLLVMKQMDSRVVECIEKVILIALCGLIGFGTINVFSNVSSQSDYADAFKNAENMIVSVPKNETKTPQSYSGYTHQYTGLNIDDLFDYTDVKTFVEQTPEIIAVESFNSAQYDAAKEDLEWARSSYDQKAYNTFTITTKDEMSGEIIPLDLVNYPIDDPYIVSKDFEVPSDWSKYYIGSDENGYITGEGYPSHSKYYVQPFDLVNGYAKLPLICGEIKQDTGVILSKNAADLLMELDGYQSYEEMIGKTMKLALRGYQNEYWDDSDNPTDFLNVIEVTINAVSSVENDFTTMIFFNNGFGYNPVYNYFVKDLNNVKMEYVRFILEPGCDYKKVAEKIDSYFNKTNVDITQYQGKGLGSDKQVYQSPAGLMIYGIVSLGIIVLLVIMLNLFRKKRNQKEFNIMHIYGYSPLLERCVRYGVIAIISFVLALIVMNPISNFINTFASEHYYQPFMTTNILLLLGMVVVTTIIMTFIETIIIGRSKND